MRFLSQAFAEFARQLSFAPPKRRRAHLERAEQLYWDIEPEREYPLDFVVYRITRYRPDTFEFAAIPGDTLRHDLLLLAEQLSESLDDSVEAYDPRPLSLAELGQQLNVTSKTIQRYRKRGLFARWLRYEDQRRRLACLPASVDRFLASRNGATQRASRFNRMDEPTRHAIVIRARRLMSRRPNLTPFQVARHLARKFERSVEAIRQLLLKHDEHDKRVAIFPKHVPPLTAGQQRAIYRTYRQGGSVEQLADRFRKSRNSVYRTIQLRRAAALKRVPLEHIASPTFEMPDAAQVILESHLPADDGPAANQPPSAAAERALFVRYNYLKYLAAQARDRLDPHQPRALELDQIETWIRRALATKARLARAHHRLVVSTARKHRATQSAAATPTVDDLAIAGQTVLLETLETFDPTRTNRFASYLAWALMRRFASMNANDPARRRRPAFDRTAGIYWPPTLNPMRYVQQSADAAAAAYNDAIATLHETERQVLTLYLGLASPREPTPLPAEQVAAKLAMPVERVRRIERRATAKLRRLRHASTTS